MPKHNTKTGSLKVVEWDVVVFEGEKQTTRSTYATYG